MPQMLVRVSLYRRISFWTWITNGMMSTAQGLLISSHVASSGALGASRFRV